MENTSIVNQSNEEIIAKASSIWDEIILGSRTKEWERFSQFFIEEDAKDPEHKADVLNQWENSPVLVSITLEKELLTVLRRQDEVLVVWKIGSDRVEGEFMGSLCLTTIDNELKVIGVLVH